MTIQSNVSKIAYTGAGTTGPFPIPWLFYADTDLTVRTTVTATGVIATLVRNVDYTLTGAGDDAGGLLALTNVLASTSTITIELTPPLTQLSEYVSGQDFPSETLEEDLDREVQIAQRLQAQLNLAIRAPDSEVVPVMTLPAVAVRANQFLAFDSSGNVINASGTGTDSALRTDLGNTTTAGKGNELVSYRRTTAEIAAGVTPTSYAIPSHDATGIFDIRRYGATEGGSNLTALNSANLVAAQINAGEIRLSVGSLVIAPWVVTAANIKITGSYLKLHASAAKAAAGPDWAPYYQLLVVNANNVEVTGVRFLGNLVVSTSNYFGGCSFVWYAQNLVGGSVHHCYFEKLRYIGGNNNVAIQVRNGAYKIKVHHNDFFNCSGAVSHQGLHGEVNFNVSEFTDAAAATPLTDTAGVSDQAFGIDGSTGNSMIGNKVYLTSGAPYSGALIGANSGTTNFNISHNEIYGMRGGVGYYIRASNHGKFVCNIIDGLGYVATATWAMVRVDADSNDVDVLDNTLRGGMTTIGGTALSVYTGGNRCAGNKVLMGANSAVCLEIAKATTPVDSVYERNFLQSAGIGTKFAVADNANAAGIEQAIIHRHNTFADPITTPYSASGINPNVKLYIENDVFTSQSLNMAGVTLTSKLTRMFRVGLAQRFAFKVGANLDIFSNENPEAGSGNYQGATYEQGDKVRSSAPTTGTTPGVVYTIPGTIAYLTPYSQAGTAASGSPIITGLANTTNVYLGDYVSPSAKWATAGPYKVIAKTSTTLTLDTNANASGAATITHFAPVFKNEAALS